MPDPGTMDNDVLMTVDGVWRYYGSVCAVKNLGFSLRRGEVVGFLGPNGAGKTTSMQMLTGVLAVSAGRIDIAGHDIIDAARAARSHIGYLPERPPLYPDLGVDEYLRYAGRLRGLRGTALTTALQRCKDRCGLAASGARLIRNLSKGYQQRVGIAQAIIHSPALVVLDEPTVGLDPIQIREIRALIRELGTDHSVILSTHILPEVQSVCDRVLIIHQGELVLDRPLAELAGTTPGLRIGLLRPPAISVLAAMPGVTRVSGIDANHFYLEHSGGQAFAEQFAAQAVASDWGLTELTPDAESLENLFIRLTGGEAVTTAAA
ncbi:MAG: ABC transporter ATP-binding protein [Gammaproteobacteria bacterium]